MVKEVVHYFLLNLTAYKMTSDVTSYKNIRFFKVNEPRKLPGIISFEQ